MAGVSVESKAFTSNEEADKLARQVSATPLLGSEPALGIPKCLAREAIKNWTENQHYNAWKNLPGHRPCKKRADDLLKLGRHQLKMVVVILTGHASVKGHLYIMGLLDGDPTCRFCRKETETVQHIICCCEALARQRFNIFGDSLVEPKDVSTASVNDLCLFIRGLRLWCIQAIIGWALKKKKKKKKKKKDFYYIFD
jgi:hypothetical protein